VTRNTRSLTVTLPPNVYAELVAEAWESELALSEYVRGLLSRRGKWARSVGAAGGYEVMGPANPPKSGARGSAMEREGGK
jgi:hypothetical protein